LGWLRRGRPRLLCARDWRYKGIAAPWNIDQISVATAQGPAQRADLKFEVTFIDMGVGPDSRHQLVPADDFPRMLDQGDQHIERAAAKTNRLVTLRQQPLGRKQAVRAERDSTLTRVRNEISHF
jgi:hypothetical protein